MPLPALLIFVALHLVVSYDGGCVQDKESRIQTSISFEWQRGVYRIFVILRGQPDLRLR